MWADNFQRINEDYKPILETQKLQANNGRVNLLNNTEETVKNRIKMFERVEVKNKATDYRNATYNIQQATKLNLMYFSAKNIQYIQDTLKNEIYKRSNGIYKLLPQNEDDLKVIMRGYFLQYVENDVGNETSELKRLNNIVLNFLIPRLMNESEGYYKYIRDQSTLVMPFDRAVPVDRDWKELQYEPFLFNVINY
jgi:hypothetical protein